MTWRTPQVAICPIGDVRALMAIVWRGAHLATLLLLGTLPNIECLERAAAVDSAGTAADDHHELQAHVNSVGDDVTNARERRSRTTCEC